MNLRNLFYLNNPLTKVVLNKLGNPYSNVLRFNRLSQARVYSYNHKRLWNKGSKCKLKTRKDINHVWKGKWILYIQLLDPEALVILFWKCLPVSSYLTCANLVFVYLENYRAFVRQVHCVISSRIATPKHPSHFRGDNMVLTLLEKAQVWLFKALMGVLFAFIQLLSPRKPVVSQKQVSPVENPLLLVSATQLAKKIRRKEVSIRSEGTRKDREVLAPSTMNLKKKRKSTDLHKRFLV